MVDNKILYKSEAGYKAAMDRYDQNLANWPVPTESLSFETRHGKTHVLATGPKDAPPLVFFHGWGGNAAATHLEFDLCQLKNYRLYSPDTLGQTGHSAGNRPPTTGPSYGEWVEDVLDGLKVDTAFLAGISGGGYLALKGAAYVPERVKKVFLISSAGLVSLRFPPLKFGLAALRAVVRPNFDNAKRFVRALSAPQATWSSAHDEMARTLEMMFRHFRFQRGPAAVTDEEMQAITAPVYVLMGHYDVACSPYKSIDRARQLIRNVEVEMVPDAGHTLPLDRLDLVMKRILEFLGEV